MVSGFRNKDSQFSFSEYNIHLFLTKSPYNRMSARQIKVESSVPGAITWTEPGNSIVLLSVIPDTESNFLLHNSQMYVSSSKKEFNRLESTPKICITIGKCYSW